MREIDFEKTSQILIHGHLCNRIGSLAPDFRDLFIASVEQLDDVIVELTNHHDNLSGFIFTDSSIELEIRYIDKLDAFVVIEFEISSPDSPPPGDPVIVVEYYQEFEDGAVLVVEELPIGMLLSGALTVFFSSRRSTRMEVLVEEAYIAHLRDNYRSQPEARAKARDERAAGGNVEGRADDHASAPPRPSVAGQQLLIGKPAREQGWLENSSVFILNPGLFKNLRIFESHSVENNISKSHGIDHLLFNSRDHLFLDGAKGTGKTALLSDLHMSALADPSSQSPQVECH